MDNMHFSQATFSKLRTFEPIYILGLQLMQCHQPDVRLTDIGRCALHAGEGIVEVVELRTTLANGSLRAVGCHKGGVGALPEGRATTQGCGAKSVGGVANTVVPAVPEGLQAAETHSRGRTFVSSLQSVICVPMSPTFKQTVPQRAWARLAMGCSAVWYGRAPPHRGLLTMLL